MPLLETRYILAVRAPRIGLNFLTGDCWSVVGRDTDERTISSKFLSAKEFVAGRGEVAVLQQRVSREGVDTRIHLRNRVSTAIGAKDMHPLSESQTRTFWEAVKHSMPKDAASPVIRAAPVRQAPAKSYGWVWKLGLGLSVAAAAVFVLTMPQVLPVTEFFIEAMMR